MPLTIINETEYEIGPYANLRSANLNGADLSHADLCGADLSHADLSNADLIHTNLSGANLRQANLICADLSGANLRGATLLCANLRGAELRGATLRAANLELIKLDLFTVLNTAPAEVAGLRLALIEGRVDGTTYQGACACLVGTLAHVAQVAYDAMPGLAPDSSRPSERFFLGISQGETPATNQVAAVVVAWIDEWRATMRRVALALGYTPPVVADPIP